MNPIPYSVHLFIVNGTMFKLLVVLGVCAGAFAQNTTTVVDVLTSLRETILLDLVQAAGLADALKTSGKHFTHYVNIAS